MFRNLSIALLFAGCSLTAFGQHLNRFNFFDSPELIFPNYAQKDYKAAVKLTNTLHKYGNAPLRYRFALNARYQVDKSHGIGANFNTVLNQNYNYFRFQAGYSYSIQLAENLHLQPGVSFDLHQIKYKKSFTPQNPNDTSTYNVGRSSLAFDMDAGLGLSSKTFDFYFGFSNLLAADYLFDQNQRTMRFMVRNRFDLIGEFGFTPGVYWQTLWIGNQLIRLNQYDSYLEADIRFDFKERFYLSGVYRYKDYLGFRFGGNFKGLHFTYGLLAQVGQTTALPGGSYFHEIGLSYRWPEDE